MSHPPVQFGRYKLLNLLGEGGMAKVYRALLSGPMGFEKEVALKRLDAKLTADERVVKALINEARLGGQLKHKNIVEIYEFNQVHGHYFMAMEYVDGWTLDALVRRCRNHREHLPASVIYEIVANICRGLEYAHALEDKGGRALNLVHRDLKPGNVMVSREGDVKLMDFGIAKADTNLYKTTAADVTKGTPVYMSPEQVTGAKLDQRSDLFSLGSIIIELITNDIPFSADNLLAIMHSVLNADITEPLQRVQARIPAFVPLLERAMAKEREERYASAAEMTQALRKIRREIEPGPTLLEWLEDNMSGLPEATTTGEFGPDGAPRPLTPRGTESLAAVAALDAEASALSLKQSGESSTPKASLGSADAGSATVGADAVAAGPPTPIGRVTKDFFDGADRGVSRDVAATRLQSPVPTEEPPTAKRRPKGGAKGKRKKKGRSALPVIVAALAAVAALIFVAVVISGRGGSEQAPSSDPVVAAAPASDPAGALTEALPTPEPEATPEAPPRSAPTAPRVVAPPPEATPEPTPAQVEEPRPTGTGTVHINAKPWANLILDGKPFGRTPQKGVSIPAGKHTLKFVCANCSGPREETVVFTLEPGGSFKKILKFDEE